MNQDLWKSIDRIRDRDPQAAREFVEQTFPQFESLCDNVPERIISLFSLAAAKLYALKAGDDFQTWIEALLPIAQKNESESTNLDGQDIPKVAELALTKYVSRPLTASLNEALTRLTLNGWLPAFGAGLPGLVYLLTREGALLGSPSPYILLFFVLPTIFSLLFSPLLGWWRQSMSTDPI